MLFYSIYHVYCRKKSITTVQSLKNVDQLE
jgi:hypothetical protein